MKRFKYARKPPKIRRYVVKNGRVRSEYIRYDEDHNNQGSANMAISSATDEEIAMDMLEPPSPTPTSLIKPSRYYMA
ncbi:hypothetical protein DPMN_016633 [Dreissena polymorpha]|uniref:Uncharacterized protein n=1 Tax=Dreissena polymorpha TaxID=45954 RepID=A0A9D4S6L4_DREPO|nr:hypothetical protein DPMN_016633 [Dreissena polymorpha]